MCADMRGVSALADNSRSRPLRAVSIQLMFAVRFVIIIALSAIEAGIRLGPYSDALANLDQGDFWPDSKSSADNFCTWLDLK